MDELTLIIISFFIVTVVTIVAVLNIIQNHKNKKIKKQIEKLEYEKNVIECAPINPELSKIEAFLKNEKLEIMYKEWKDRLEVIKTGYIPKLTDMIIEAEYSLSRMDYKGTTYKLAKLEMEIYKVRTTAEILLEEIKEITTSEEKNRAIVTTLKTKYRKLYQKFNETKIEYGEIEKSISLQFENIANRFEKFESAMENNEYTEVTQIIKAVDEMIKHMEMVVEETPVIVMTATTILPKKIKEIEYIYDSMISGGYPLSYLNVEYNIEEANKKIEDIIGRLKVLNLEDSLFELKVLLDYFDSLFNDFEKEKSNRSIYEETKDNFKYKLDKTNRLIADIFIQLDDIKKVYNLSKDDIDFLKKVRGELKDLNKDYNLLDSHTNNNRFAYSRLVKEIEMLSLKLSNVEERLENSLDAIGTMKADEARARQQLDEIKLILKDSKNKLREYNLPVVPKTYYVELNEASAAIREIVVELEKTPITISVLNTRVDTARDLVLKLFSTTKE
ncbi:MAG: septation ring formation regulator EzrA, partial [Bacilli bacterium]|nr:septation ring formation regulator EzrA [Bacilli bacterium]